MDTVTASIFCRPLFSRLTFCRILKRNCTHLLEVKDSQKETNKILNREQRSLFVIFLRLSVLLFLLLFYVLYVVLSRILCCFT